MFNKQSKQTNRKQMRTSAGEDMSQGKKLFTMEENRN